MIGYLTLSNNILNKTQIFKTIKRLEGFNKSIEHDSFEKSKKYR